MLMLISILICSEYFHMTKIICARNVKTASVSGLGFWYWIQSPEFQVLHPDTGSGVAGPTSWDLDLGFQVPGIGSQSIQCPLQSMAKKSSESVTGITKFDSYCKV